MATAFTALAEARGERVSYRCVTADQLRIDFCRSCGSCFAQGTCPLDATDDVGRLKQSLLEADVILFGTPVYLASMSGATKCVLDRIAYWTHLLELAGKVVMVLVTTSNNHGPEVEGQLSDLSRATGLSQPEGICLQLHARPHLGVPEEADPLLDAATARLWAAWEDPASYLTEQQNLYAKGLAIRTRRRVIRHYLFGDALDHETRILDERRFGVHPRRWQKG